MESMGAAAHHCPHNRQIRPKPARQFEADLNDIPLTVLSLSMSLPAARPRSCSISEHYGTPFASGSNGPQSGMHTRDWSALASGVAGQEGAVEKAGAHSLELCGEQETRNLHDNLGPKRYTALWWTMTSVDVCAPMGVAASS